MQLKRFFCVLILQVLYNLHTFVGSYYSLTLKNIYNAYHENKRLLFKYKQIQTTRNVIFIGIAFCLYIWTKSSDQ